MTVNIIQDNLTQDEALELERKVIEDYVFVKGYGIDIIGYNNNKNENGHLTNHTFGGDGSYGSVHDEKWCKQHSTDMLGENNPMYGVNVWDYYSKEKADSVRKKLSESSKGKNNAMFGISPKQRMDEETYFKWLKKHQERDMFGKNNPNWGNDTLRKKYEDHPELKLQLSRPGEQNGMAKRIYVYDLDMNFISEFGYIGECCEWLNTFEKKPRKINSLRIMISSVLDKNKPYKKYYYFSEKQ